MKNIPQLSDKRRFMYGRKISLACLLCMALLNACKKTNDIPGMASLIIFNGVVGSDTLVTNFSGTAPITWYKQANQLYYGFPGDAFPFIDRNNNRFNWYSGQQRVAFFEYPDTLAHSKPVVDLVLDLPVGTINSLFLTGSMDAPDTFFTRDQVPGHSIADSTAGIRVVNLVKGIAVSMNIQGLAPGSEVATLGYKKASPFSNYDIKKQTDVYVFEIRDALTGDLIAAETIDPQDTDIGFGLSNNYRFRNFSIIIYGALNNTGTGAISSTIMSNY